MILGDLAPVFLPHIGAIGNTQQRLMRRIQITRRELYIIGRNQGDIMGVGEFDQSGLSRSALDAPLRRTVMALQFDVEMITKGFLHGTQGSIGFFRFALAEQHIHRSIETARQQDQPFAVRDNLIPADMRLLGRIGIDIGNGG